MWVLVCQWKPKHVGAGLSVETEIFGSWCVSEDRNIWDLVYQW